MDGDPRIPVLLHRDSWEQILLALERADTPTPLAMRLRDAVDEALNERIGESVDRFMQASGGE